MDLNLTGKTALVCGSTQGIGRAAAEELALLGAKVILLARNEARLAEVCEALPRPSAQQHSWRSADFSINAEVAEVAASLAAEETVHILINNTGGPPGGKAIDAEADDYLTAFSAHLINNQILAKALVPGMKRAHYGRIVNVISTSVKQPLPNLGVSNTVRGAVANWSKTLANELGAFGITVNNVLPGATDTARLSQIISSKSGQTGVDEDNIRSGMAAAVPAQRIGRPEEIGAAIAFLCSPAAAYINGVNLPVDGGRTSAL